LIPDFDENGQLPPGIHRAGRDEIIERFGRGSDDREAGRQSIRWLVPMCKRAGIARILLNGSFVTDCREPRDVGCVLVPGKMFDPDSDAAMALEIGLPYLSIQVVETDDDYGFYVNELFSSDRDGRSKGLVEILL
jgi:uncharacterized protein DUF6932